jgi:hypothetical protein
MMATSVRLAHIVYVEVAGIHVPGDGSSGLVETRIRVQFDSAEGPGEVTLSGNQVRALGIFEAHHHGRAIFIPIH